MAWALCTSGSAVAVAGLNANSTIATSGSVMWQWSEDAEGRIIAETRRSWVDDYSSLSDGIKGILSDACASLIANRIINYDMSGFTSRQEATTMLDVNYDRYNEALGILKDFKSNTIQST